MPFSFPLKNSAYMVGVLSGLALTAFPVVAYAGFEWSPPPAQQQQVAPAPGAEPPQGASPASPLTPEPADVVPAPVGNIEAIPASPAPGAAAPTPLNEFPVAAPVTSQETGDAIVEGFGKDIPLALALRDIVPSSYAYVFATNDIAGTRISWRGGKPWQTVLQTALAAKNLQATITSHVIEISTGATSAVPPAAPVPQLSIQEHPAPLTTAPAMAAPTPLMTPSQQDLPPIPVSSSPATATPTALPVIDLSAIHTWNAKSGTTLRDTLDAWAKTAHVELVWSTTYDYPVNNAFSFKGTFGQAVDSLLASYNQETSPPKGRLHPNLPSGPSVLIIN